jgi:hypothetical protein
MPDDDEQETTEPETEGEDTEGQDESVEGEAEGESEAEGDADTEGEPEQQPQGRQQKGKRQPPPAESDLDRVKRALAAERTNRKKLEKDMATLRRQHASAEERALLEARETAATEREAEIRPPLIKALAAAELRASGVQGSAPARLVGLLDLDKVDVDEDGNLVGLDDQIAGLKEEFPNLFAAPPEDGGKQRTPQANAGAGGRRGDKGGPVKPKPWYEQLADQVLNAQAPPGVGHR